MHLSIHILLTLLYIQHAVFAKSTPTQFKLTESIPAVEEKTENKISIEKTENDVLHRHDEFSNSVAVLDISEIKTINSEISNELLRRKRQHFPHHDHKDEPQANAGHSHGFHGGHSHHGGTDFHGHSGFHGGSFGVHGAGDSGGHSKLQSELHGSASSFHGSSFHGSGFESSTRSNSVSATNGGFTSGHSVQGGPSGHVHTGGHRGPGGFGGHGSSDHQHGGGGHGAHNHGGGGHGDHNHGGHRGPPGGRGGPMGGRGGPPGGGGRRGPSGGRGGSGNDGAKTASGITGALAAGAGLLSVLIPNPITPIIAATAGAVSATTGLIG